MRKLTTSVTQGSLLSVSPIVVCLNRPYNYIESVGPLEVNHAVAVEYQELGISIRDRRRLDSGSDRFKLLRCSKGHFEIFCANSVRGGMSEINGALVVVIISAGSAWSTLGFL